jgi:DNA-binding NtrC family response regulator
MDFDVTDFFLGGSDDVQRVLELAQLYAQLVGPILLLGPTGVGKGLLAKLLHRMSGRPGDFVVRTGGQLVDSLFHSQLFGSRRGAFTGADRDVPGAFEQANTGTLFLDELPLWSLAAQSAVLRVVDERVVLPVGARGELGVTCGMVFASSRPLDELVGEQRLLPDLRYRIRDFAIEIAPLAARRGDIAELAYHFLGAQRARAPGGGHPAPVLFSSEALARLLVYEWPGNVRQLEGAVAFGCVHARGAERIEECHLPQYLRTGPAVSFTDLNAPLRRQLVAWARQRAQGRRREAAALLGVHPGTVDYHRRREGAGR